MKAQVALSWKLAILLFIVLALGFKVALPIAALVCVVLPAARIELSLTWKLAAAVAVVASVLQKAWDHQIACIAGKLFRDLLRSRVRSLVYRLIGGVVPFADEAAPLPPLSKPKPRHVEVVRTAKHTSERLKVLAPLLLTAGSPPMSVPAVMIDASQHFQTFLGFGGAFTESAAEVLLRMSPTNQETILDAYFRTDIGLGYKLGRLHMNSCDFSRGNWSCTQVPGDVELSSFSIDRYKAAILPMVRRAQQRSGPLTLLASPWSPPAWMKDTGTMMTGGKLLPQYRSAWAKHYVRFAQALKEEGLPLWGFSVQNEPHASTPWENCLYSHEEERDFVRDYLGPSLEASGLDLKLLVWDHNRDDMFARAKTVYDDAEAAKYVWGVAYHWYGDPRYEIWPAREGQVLFDNVRRVHELRPDKHIMMTEACGEFGPGIGEWRIGERYGEAILNDLNNWMEAWIDWNLVLDETGGPNHVKNLVSSPVIADTARDKVLFLAPFFYIGHFSRYILPGAKRILAASNRDGLEVTAFENPDRSIAVVVLNRGDYLVDFALQRKGEYAMAEAPAHSITTFILAGESPPSKVPAK